MIWVFERHDLPADVGAFVRGIEGGRWAALERSGRGLGLGVWESVLGGGRGLVVLTRYAGLADWAPSPDATRSFAAFAAGPRAPSERAPEPDPGVYTLRAFRLPAARQAKLLSIMEGATMPFFEAAGVREAGVFRSVLDVDPAIHVLARYRDLRHWEETFGAGPEPAEPEAKRRWKDVRAAILERDALADHVGVEVLLPRSERRP